MYRNTIVTQVEKIKDIPTMLTVAMEIERLTQDINTSAGQLAEVIKLDPSLTGKVLKIANSAAYASINNITNLNQVISRLGFAEVRKIAMSVAVLNSFKNTYVDYERFWIHSITTAYLALYLHKIANPSRKNQQIFSCGILHDVGVLIMDQYFPDLYKKVFDIAAKRKFDLQLVEKKILGITHAEVGAILLKKWKLPESITETVEMHHSPQLSKNEQYNTRLVYLANFICNNRGIDNGTGFFPEGFYDDIWEEVNLSIEDVPKILENVDEEINVAKQVLKLGGM